MSSESLSVREGRPRSLMAEEVVEKNDKVVLPYVSYCQLLEKG